MEPSSSRTATHFVLEPPVLCGRCGSFMRIQEWWVLEDASTNDGQVLGTLPVPHPNRAHPCGSCGEVWMPDSGTPGHLMSYVDGLLVFTG